MSAQRVDSCFLVVLLLPTYVHTLAGPSRYNILPIHENAAVKARLRPQANCALVDLVVIFFTTSKQIIHYVRVS